MSRFRRYIKWLRQTLVVFIITFLLLEGVFRTYHYFRPSFIFYDTSYNRYRGKPNSADYDFQLNSQGFKDVEFKPQKEGYRIVALGDSFAFGVVPYRHNYLTLLEENLNQAGKKAEVLNFGIPATDTKDYLVLLVKEGLAFKPDMVIVCFFIGNDFFDEKGRWHRLSRLSYVVSFFRYLIVSWRGTGGRIIHGNAVYDDRAPSLTDDVFLQLEVGRSEIFRKENDAFAGYLANALLDLARIKEICEQRQIALAVVLVPDIVQIDAALQARVLQVKGARPEDFDFALPNRQLASKLNDNRIECFDLLDGFLTRGARDTLYKPNDTHWNIAGNRLAADLITSGVFHLEPPTKEANGSEQKAR